MGQDQTKVEQDRRLLGDAQAKGTGATLGAYVRLSGPGWLQSAITLGGGSLAGALFLGSMGGYSMLWLQLLAIVIGVIMLSAISYVTLSTGERPFNAINRHVNPVLGWGWLVATGLANIIWCMPQFSLCYTSLQKNLLPETMEDNHQSKMIVSLVILAVVSVVVFLNTRRGMAAKIFDLLLKALVGMIVICFVGVVVLLTMKGELEWGQIFAGFIPDINQFFKPAGNLGTLVAGLPAEQQAFWTDKVMRIQRNQMIAATATAVGINMTFLMPYSMLHRGWDKTFRGLARFDLMTGMAIPYILVTSCVLIASAYAFSGKADKAFLSDDPTQLYNSPLFAGTQSVLLKRVRPDMSAEQMDEANAALKKWKEDDPKKPAKQDLALRAKLFREMVKLPKAEKLLAAATVNKDAVELSKTLAPFIGEQRARFVFGLGVFGMGFSTIIILMLINGFVFCEAMGKPDHKVYYAAGCMVAGVMGAMWPYVWSGDSQFWFTVIASTFGAMLLPIAYITFFMMMNSRSLMGKEKPTGGSMIVWNILMGISSIVATVWAVTSLYNKVSDTSSPQTVLQGQVIVGLLVAYLVLVVAGFFLRSKGNKLVKDTAG